MIVEEAGIRLELPEGVFYNPVMRINRDITEALVATLGISSYADVMAASGIRGLRIARHGVEVYLNDKSRLAYATILRNSKHLDNIKASNLDIRDFLRLYRGIEFIDLDPFGSPAEFIPLVVDYRPIYLGVTATDTANYCKYLHAGKRLYFVHLARCPCCHEIGLRIILYVLAREAAKLDMIIEPLVSYYYKHHVRVIVRLLKAGSSAIENMLDNEIGRIRYDDQRYSIEVVEGISSGGDIGPLRINDIGNAEIIRKIIGFRRNAKETDKLLEKLLIDSRAPVGFYDLHEIARRLHTSPISKKKLIEIGEKHGIRLAETHFSPKALKAKSVDDVYKAFEIASRREP